MIRKRRREEEHENLERWLLTYADLITLLLGLFVILYAMSKIDTPRYGELVAALTGIFGKGEHGVIQGHAGMVPPPIAGAGGDERAAIEKEVKKEMSGTMASGLISVEQNERGVTVHMMEELLFASGSADLKDASLKVLDPLAEILKKMPNDIRVEGHTDDVPIHNDKFPSNWHLSVARAMTTAYYLIERHELTPWKIAVAGYSQYRPLLPNTTPENRARNRRVDIVIVTGEPKKTAAPGAK
ncbi:MAG TPA: flagellar motor protein MotB [Bacteroidota bacterium]|nr:flagellar motor protein MotB [Bacteroidota bacterium]